MALSTLTIIFAFLCWRLRLASAQDFTYLGCYYDSNFREALPDLIYCDRDRHPYESCQNLCGPESQYCQSQSMTIELCRDICADQNMKYFGLQAGTQCLCGGFFAPYDSLNQPMGQNGTCNRPCSGNSNQLCGADFQSSVYLIDEPASDCYNPGYVLNGDQSQQDNSSYNIGDTINFATVCPPPSIKNGAGTIECDASGNWTNPPPTCTVRCATPIAPIHASFSAGQTLNVSYAVDDEVLFDCDNDQARTNQVLRCDFYGDWITFVNMCPEPTTTVPTTTRPATTRQLTTKMHSTASTTLSVTLSITTITTLARGGGNITTQTVATVANTTDIPSNSSSGVSTTPAADTSTTGSSGTIGTTENIRTATSGMPGGPPTTESSTMTKATTSSTSSTIDTTSSSSSNTTPPPMSTSASSMAPSTTDGGESTPEPMMTSSQGGMGTSQQATSGGGGGPTTVDSGRNQGEDLDLLPIIIGAAAGILVIIVIIVVVSVCCSRKRKQKTRKIPFDPALGDSFGNPAFEEDEEERSRRGFVQENDYGDRQTYDIGVSDYAMAAGDEKDRNPPDGKDSPGASGADDAVYSTVDKTRQGSVTSFKPDDHRVSWATLPSNHNGHFNTPYDGNGHSHLIEDNGYSEYYTDPQNQVATPL